MTHPIPDAALDDRLGIVGTAGSGKTYGAGTAVERLLHRKSRAIIVDPLGVWWGLRLLADGSTASTFAPVIFGGPHGDLPINEHAGTLVGEAVAGIRESVILDLSEIGTKAGERRFMLGFLTAVYRHASREPVHIVFDEADMWAPQQVRDKDGEAAKLLGMMETLVRRGRIKGFIPWLISQRPAVLNKDVLSQVDGLVAFKLTASQDRAALGAWIEGSADRVEGRQILGELPAKAQGEAVVWLPSRGVLSSARFPEKVTFDSSRTPKRGEVRRTADLKPLDTAALKDRLAKVEAEAKANDPRALKAEIARLKKEIATKPAGATTERIVEKPVADPKAMAAAEKRGRALGYADGYTEATKHFDAAIERLHRAQEAANDRIGKLVSSVPDAPVAAPVAVQRTVPVARPMPARSVGNGVDHTGTLGLGERKVLIAIAQYPDGATREQVTILTGYKRSTRDAYIQRLSARGLVGLSGGMVVATEDGIAELGSDYEPLPTGEALREHWLRELPEGERRIFAEVIANYPNAVPRDTLSDATGYKRSTRDAYIQRLSTRRLVEPTRDGVTASDVLFN